MGMSKVELPVQRTDSFADRTSSPRFSHHIHADPKGDTDIEGRKLNTLDASFCSLGSFKPNTEDGKGIDENCSISSYETQDDLCNLITNFSRIYPSTTGTDGEKDSKAVQALESLLLKLAAPISLQTEATGHHFSPANIPHNSVSSTAQFSDSTHGLGPDEEITNLDVGKSPGKIVDYDCLLPPEHADECGEEVLDDIRWMENVLMDIVNHLEYVISLSVPLTTWNHSGTISAICRARCARFLRQFNGHRLNEEAEPIATDTHNSDLQSVSSLLASLALANDTINKEALKQWEVVKDKCIGSRLCQAAVLSFELKYAFTLSETYDLNFRLIILSLRQRISICDQIVRKLRCEEGLMWDDAALLSPNLQMHEKGEDFDDFNDLATVSRIKAMVQYVRELHSVTPESTLSVGGLVERTNELQQRIGRWGQQFDNLWLELNQIWTGKASSEVDDRRRDSFNSLKDQLSSIKAELDDSIIQHSRVKTDAANLYVLRHYDESKLQIIDMEARIEEMEHCIEVLDKYDGWCKLCATIQGNIPTMDETIMAILEKRHKWAANLKNVSIHATSDDLREQKNSLDKSIMNLQLQGFEAMLGEMELLVIMYRTGYPTRLRDQQLSLRIKLKKLYDGMRFTDSIYLQHSQVSKLQKRTADMDTLYVTLKQIPPSELSVRQLNETCKEVIELLLASQIGITYPQNPSNYDIAKNVYANRQVKSGIGTLQNSLSEMLDGLKELIQTCHTEQELRKHIEQTKVIAGRHKQLVQAQINSLEHHPVNVTARMPLSRLDECTSNCKASVERPLIFCIAGQEKLLQSSNELSMVYEKELDEITTLSDQLATAQENQLIHLNIIRTRAVWEAYYEENIKLLEVLFDQLCSITKSCWMYANQNLHHEPVDLTIWNSDKVVKLMIEEQIAFEVFQKEFFRLADEDQDLQLILSDAETRHERLANVQELIFLAQDIQEERMKQRSQMNDVTKTYEETQKLTDDIYNGLMQAISEAKSDESVYVVDMAKIQDSLTKFEDQCQLAVLYPDCYQHTQLPQRYSAELNISNEEARRHVSHTQDNLYQSVTRVLEAHAVYRDLLSLLHESRRHQESCTNLLTYIDIPDNVTLHDPALINHNTILTLVQCSRAQNQRTDLQDMSKNIIDQLEVLSDRASQLQGQNHWGLSFARHISTIMETTNNLSAIDKIVQTAITLYARQNWESLWIISKEKLEQCIILLEVIHGQDKSVPAESRSQSIDGAEQQFRFITQTDVASSNFAFRNLSKCYLCISQSKVILQKLQQKHGELRRLASKIEWLLAKCRGGPNDHMNSRVRKLSTPTALEGRARKISLPSRKSSNSLSAGGGFDGNLKASRSAVISNQPRMRQNSSSRVQNRLRYIPDPANDLDVEVGRIINESPYQISVKAVPGEVGRYWFGEVQPRLAYCRILKSSMVMVRVGGGWTELTQFLRNHALLEGNFIPRERSLTEDEELREGYIRTNSSRTSNTRSEHYGIKDGNRFIVGNGIEVKMTRAQDERTVPPRTSRTNHLQN
ncbi:hypothetical protein INT43_004852 [Umbelopsis isabellina]|uniref:GAR domain-containing protein n=1 Tax=Mortierella isabellina TaxID=91625 RepID=A0A8H7U7W6_MORIS|nr:hypothetical protein INT43_004852 [Umbelopsis isabellina]